MWGIQTASGRQRLERLADGDGGGGDAEMRSRCTKDSRETMIEEVHRLQGENERERELTSIASRLRGKQLQTCLREARRV